jgi:NadR type nicotinamide-nucleotide adenylyltransferase
MASIRTPQPAAARVALLGGESSGKSTLAAVLAAHYRTVWVPEYLREFTENAGRPPLEHEQLGVAQTQIEREYRALPQARRFLFCDTTPLMIALYSEFCFGRIDAALAALARQHGYDFTIVTAPDIAWVADGLQRASDQVRQAIHQAVVARLQDAATPFLLASGSLEHRLQQSVAYIELCGRH